MSYRHTLTVLAFDSSAIDKRKLTDRIHEAIAEVLKESAGNNNWAISWELSEEEALNVGLGQPAQAE